MNEANAKPVVLITGAAGNLGTSIAEALSVRYQVIGIDRSAGDVEFPIIEADLTSPKSIDAALDEVRDRWGARLASVIHLAAFFDFTGEEHPLYEELNVQGTRLVLCALRERFEVAQFVYASTMLVHTPGKPGERIDENWPIAPRWAYPASKAAGERIVEAESGGVPFVLLRMAGVYDEETMVPTFAHQIARIYERGFESYFYAGDVNVGQSMLHRCDMIDAVRRTVDLRTTLPSAIAILIGEPETLGYDSLQDEIGYLIHGSEDWPTIRLPKPVASLGAWAQEKLEPVIPDAIDKGEEPFIKPFMVTMADDHYALDIRRANKLLGWVPTHSLKNSLPEIVANLKRDPIGWYRANGITPPEWLEETAELGLNPTELNERHEGKMRAEHGAFRWAHFVNLALGTWLLTQPPLINVEPPALARTEVALGAALIVFATLSLSWRMQWARWVCAAIGIAVMAVPFVFWTGNAAAYLSDTLVGMLVFSFALAGRPEPGTSALAALSGPETPPGWSYNPSTWSQRLPIVLLAIIGLYVSRWLAAYQMEHIPGVWEPFFAGDPMNPQNGTEEIITSDVSEAFPVPDAALGGFVYALEVVTGIIGSRLRWRTMPWLVIFFGILIAPLGIVSIGFIIIQPIVIGTWSTLTLIGAAAMLIQIPYSLDELLASIQFVRRRAKAGQNWLRVLLTGDTDDASGDRPQKDEFDAAPTNVVREMVSGGVNLPWNLALCIPIGAWLMLTPATLGINGTMADANHLIGAVVLTAISICAAEVARPVRFLLVPAGIALFIIPFAFEASGTVIVASIACGIALVSLSLRRGAVKHRYGRWNALLI